MAQAQEQEYRLSISASLGTSYSDLMNFKSPFSYYDFKTKFINNEFYLINVDYKLTRKISVSLGYGYDVRGTSVDYNDVSHNNFGPVVYLTYYVQLAKQVKNEYQFFPIEVKYQWFKKNKIALSSGIGFYLASLQKGFVGGSLHERTIEHDTLVVLDQYSTFYDYTKRSTNDFDYGLIVSLGGAYEFTKRIGVEVGIKLWYGLRRLDSQHSDNSRTVISTSGFQTFNYDYYGLSSYSRNVAYSATIGIHYKFLKR